MAPTVLGSLETRSEMNPFAGRRFTGKCSQETSTSEGNKERRVGQKIKLTHNVIVSEASVDSTESSGF